MRKALLHVTSVSRLGIVASDALRHAASWRLAAKAGAIGWLVAGCGGMQSALRPQGPQAGRIASEWWLFFWVCTAVFLAVAGVLLYAVAHARRGQPADTPEVEGTGTAFVAGGAILTVHILVVFLVYSASTGRAITNFPADNRLTIEVIGHQWWWEVRYLDPDPNRLVTTANEIHIPVGQPVLFRVTARDVIHSFWVPNLHGKIDLIPGQDNTT
jgi:cytochrome c oxidase subunit 2